MKKILGLAGMLILLAIAVNIAVPILTVLGNLLKVNMDLVIWIVRGMFDASVWMIKWIFNSIYSLLKYTAVDGPLTVRAAFWIGAVYVIRNFLRKNMDKGRPDEQQHDQQHEQQ